MPDFLARRSMAWRKVECPSQYRQKIQHEAINPARKSKAARKFHRQPLKHALGIAEREPMVNYKVGMHGKNISPTEPPRRANF